MKRGLLISFIFLAAAATVASNRAWSTEAIAQKASGDEVREEFHQSFPITATGRVSIENLNGGVHITVWDQNEVKVDAVKRAYRRERLNEAKIEIAATGDTIRIKTRYPYEDQTFTDEESRRYNNPANVEYSLTIPRQARLDSAELINGSLEIEGVQGDVKASSINGRLAARGLAGEVRLSTINGGLEATFSHLDELKSVNLNSVNGSVTLILPSDSNGQLKASTIHGGISNDFGLPVQDGEYVGHELFGQLGNGGPRIRLGNVNGSIRIKHAADGRSLSPATNLLAESDHLRRIDIDTRRLAEEAREQARAQVDAQRIAQQAQAEAQREAERAIREAQLEAARAQGEVQREIQREAQRKAREQASENRVKSVRGNRIVMTGRFVDRESKSFVVSGTPTVNISTFDGPVIVRGWDKSEVMYNATKRAHDEGTVKQINVDSSQQGSAIQIVAKSDYSNGSAALEVYVPRNATVHVSSDDGSLSVQAVSGEIVARTGDGSIEVIDGRGRLQANTGDGSIRVSNHNGEVDARTGDGSISLEGSFTAVSARTGDGSIVLRVPTDSNFVIETNTDAISNEGLSVSEDIAPSTRVKRWKIGRGGAIFTLHTGDGRVILRPH